VPANQRGRPSAQRPELNGPCRVGGQTANAREPYSACETVTTIPMIKTVKPQNTRESFRIPIIPTPPTQCVDDPTISAT
jgi:hypothetical protein